MFFDRAGGEGSAKNKRTSTDTTFRGPVKGLIRAQAMGEGPNGGAEVLQNIFPTTEGGRIRGGSVKLATLTRAPTLLASYDSAVVKLFAFTDAAIFDATTPPSVTDPLVAVRGSFTSGDWTAIQFGAAGGSYLICVNGANDMQQFDGTDWLAINPSTVALGRAITGVSTSGISHVWSHQKRLWMVQKGTTSAWYLENVGAIGGAASEFPLGSVFKEGGELLFGATWSVDVGDGQNDQNVFVSSKGEIAIYQGNDPATNFDLVGLYRIGRPLHKNAHFRGGSDVAILTEDGIVSISAATMLDRAGLASKAITSPIEELWKRYVLDRLTPDQKFTCVLWPERGLLMIGVPTPDGEAPVALAANARTGAWCTITNWDIRSSAVHRGGFYFGGPKKICAGDVLGSDEGNAYRAVYLPRFQTLKSSNQKELIHARVSYRASEYFDVELFGAVDFDPTIPPSVLPSNSGNMASSLWDSSLWDDETVFWDFGIEYKITTSEWQTVQGMGYAISAGVSFIIQQADTPKVEILPIDLMYRNGAVLV